jgi:ABC-type antimicrobial peptide transport system permease subunit
MFFNYLISSIRNIVKNKVFSAINILGLAAGMAAVLVIFLWVRDELSYERYHDKADQVSLAYLMMTSGDDALWEQVAFQPTTAPAVANELITNYPEVLQTARCGDLGETIFTKDNDAVIEPAGLAAETSVFDILTYRFLQGDPKTALTQPYTLVLTEKLAKKYFFDQDPIGKTIKLNNKRTFTVTGIIENMPENAYRKYDFFVPFDYLEELGYDIKSTEMFFPCYYYTYVLLQKGANLDSLNAKLSRHIFFDGKEARGKIGFVNLLNVYLTETGGTTRIYIFCVIAFVILLIACINYANLSAASAVGRLKEIFTRKVNGAERKQLVGQFFMESFLITFVGLMIGIAIVYWFLPHFNQLTGKTITFSLLDISTLISVLLLLVVTSVVAGVYPAFLLSTIKMRGPAEIFPQTLGRKRNFQRILLFIQLTLTVIFIISSIVIYGQSHYIRNYNLGLNKKNVLYTRLGGSIKEKILLLKRELLANPDILAVSSAAHLPNAIQVGSFFTWGLPSLPGTRMVYTAADYDYLKTFDMSLARGRFYQPEFSTDSSETIVVNEAAMRKLGVNIPIDSQFYFVNRNLKLIGVVKDFQHNTPINIGVEPMCIILSSNNNDFLFVRINPEIQDAAKLARTLQYINNTGKSLSPDYPLDFRFLDTFSFPADRALESWQKLVLYSCIISIVITCMGLLALIFLNTSQRTREIGIYKVNGARIIDIMLKFYRSYLLLAVLANVIAWPAALFLMKRFIQGFANQAPISWWIFPVAGLISMLIILVTTTWHIYYVASRNPAEALRYE